MDLFSREFWVADHLEQTINKPDSAESFGLDNIIGGWRRHLGCILYGAAWHWNFIVGPVAISRASSGPKSKFQASSVDRHSAQHRRRGPIMRVQYQQLWTLQCEVMPFSDVGWGCPCPPLPSHWMNSVGPPCPSFGSWTFGPILLLKCWSKRSIISAVILLCWWNLIFIFQSQLPDKMTKESDPHMISSETEPSSSLGTVEMAATMTATTPLHSSSMSSSTTAVVSSCELKVVWSKSEKLSTQDLLPAGVNKKPFACLFQDRQFQIFLDIYSPLSGVNKKPFVCPFQDRQFQNPYKTIDSFRNFYLW